MKFQTALFLAVCFSASASTLTLTNINSRNLPDTNLVYSVQADTNRPTLANGTVYTIGFPTVWQPGANGAVSIYQVTGNWVIYGPALGRGLLYRFPDSSTNATAIPLSGFNTFQTPMVSNPNSLTNNESNVTLAGTFSGNGAGLTNLAGGTASTVAGVAFSQRYKYIGESQDGNQSVSLMECFNPTNPGVKIEIYSDPTRSIFTPMHIYSGGQYWMFYETVDSGGHYNTLGAAVSPDDYHWTFNGYFPFPTNTIRTQWSPKLFYGPSNDLHLMLLVSTNNGAAPFAEALFDLNAANPTNWTNFRQLVFTNSSTSNPNSLSGYMVYNNGYFYFFDGAGNIYDSTTLATNTWSFITNGTSSLGAAPDVAFIDGLWYANATIPFPYYFRTSRDLTNWSALQTAPLNGSLLNEGTAIVENSATSPLPIYPVLNGDGSSLTNVVAIAVTSQLGTPAVSFDPNDEVLIGNPAGGYFFADTTNNDFNFNQPVLAPNFTGPGTGLTGIPASSITGGLNMIVTNMWSSTLTNRLYFTNGILVKFTSP